MMVFNKAYRINTETYDYNINGISFLVDIVEIVHPNHTEFEAWISGKQYGIKSLMFGIEKDWYKDKQYFLQLVESSIYDYAKDYADVYMDGEEWEAIVQ